MPHKVPPESSPFLDTLEQIRPKGGELRRWRGEKGRIYTWDELHGEVELFNKRGRHLGTADAMTGDLVKDAVEGRFIDV